MQITRQRVSVFAISISLIVMMGQGCPTPAPSSGGTATLPGSSTISSLDVTDAIVGGTGHVRVTLVDPVSGDTQVALAAGSAGILDLPATLTIVEGSASGTADYQALKPGLTTITASLGDSQSTETAHVVDSLKIVELDASGASLDSGGTAVQTGASGTIEVYLNASVAANTTVTLSSDNPAVIAVPSAIIVPEFKDEQDVAFSALAAGVATISAQLNGQTFTTKIAVSDSVSLQSINAVSPFQVGIFGELDVKLDVATAVDAQVSLTSSNPAVASIPATAVIPAGESEIFVPFQTLAAGQSNLTARLGSVSRSFPISVLNGISLSLFAVEADFLRTEAKLLAG